MFYPLTSLGDLIIPYKKSSSAQGNAQQKVIQEFKGNVGLSPPPPPPPRPLLSI
jgi:hypothetical protein